MNNYVESFDEEIELNKFKEYIDDNISKNTNTSNEQLFIDFCNISHRDCLIFKS